MKPDIQLIRIDRDDGTSMLVHGPTNIRAWVERTGFRLPEEGYEWESRTAQWNAYDRAVQGLAEMDPIHLGKILHMVLDRLGVRK